MQDILRDSLRQLKRKHAFRMRMLAILLVLSLLVSLDVFWTLRQPGLTLAGDADCHIVEHTHDEGCQDCQLTEHTHTLACYADEEVDLETQLDWQRMFAAYPFTGNLGEDLVGIAKTQVGYAESAQNFVVDQSGIRHGYTRYGAWYGIPYSNWSTLFVSFCLHYAGADAQVFPVNTGAATMAQQWQRSGRYAALGQYTPTGGDLVFFKDNTVGIVTAVHSTTVQVIRGDVDDAVVSSILSLSDASIDGWGLVSHSLTDGNRPATFGKPSFLILEGETVTTPLRAYALRRTVTVIDLLPYLEANGGSYFFTLLDQNNQELPKDANGNYIAEATTGYRLTLTFNSPEGFLPGTYEYQVPNGLMVNGGAGTFTLKDGTEVGSWTVTDTGLITLVFNDQMNSRTDITISATMGINFPEQDDVIDFDGKITVSVEKPPPQSNPTMMNKWGNQGGVEGSNGADPSKIYWGLEIIGNADSQIPGSILTDRIIDGEWSKIHRFTESDIAGGLSFGVADSSGGWHNWVVTADDPHLIWTETGWSYKMPQTAVCQWCGEIELGNEGWYYYIHYSSTPSPAGMAGTFGYENEATIDGAYGYSWVNFTQGEATGEVIKNGSFSSDASGGGFLWEFQATIPGRQEGKRADYHWYLMDNMKLLDAYGDFAGYVENDAHLSTVMVTYQGNTFEVPRIQDATDSDLFAWDNGWSATDNGITHGREFNLLMRCQCTPDTCHWGNSCGDYWYQKDDGTYAINGYCQCWTATENVTFTFVYETKDMAILEQYGGLGYQVLNNIELFYIPEGASGGASVDRADAVVPVPGVFKKELTHDFDGYTANYKITVNEAKLALTDGSPLTIRDEMTDTLAYIAGSLVITAEDAAGHITTLQQGTDYTVTYDGTGNHTDKYGNEIHLLEIVILHPQPVMYLLDYDATLVLPNVVTGGIKYTNSAVITLWGESVTDATVEKVYADINIAAKSYRVELFKTSAATGEPLGGATFGLYNSQGGLITTEVTNRNGQILYQTNIIEGIILREHVLYYMQELRAPPGYQLDDTQYWFCFCSGTDNACKKCQEVMAGTDATRIPFEQIGKVNAVNYLLHYDLPATGGTGVYPLLLVSVLFILTPLVYGFIRRRKRERRGVG